MYENGLKFESDKHLARVKAPILILHAEDDMVIPITLGRKVGSLYTFCRLVFMYYSFEGKKYCVILQFASLFQSY